MKGTAKTKRRDHDFTRGVRGKHVNRLKNGHKTMILKGDGSIDSYSTRPVILDQDVQSVFKDSKAVNKALRGLIERGPGRIQG